VLAAVLRAPAELERIIAAVDEPGAELRADIEDFRSAQR
jgi:hypothetical protein